MTPRAGRTREALIDATVAALREDGSFTTEQVAGLAGVSVATVYNRIPEGRDGLLAGALDRALFRLVAVTAEALTVEHLLDEGLECVLVALVDGLVGVFDEEALVLRSALARLPARRLLRAAGAGGHRRGGPIERGGVRAAPRGTRAPGRVHAELPDVARDLPVRVEAPP